MRILRTRRGARIVERDAVLSEVLGAPGPTHSVFDVLAAAVATLAPGPRIALLGFAGGGMIAPLRAMRCDLPIEAVDLSRQGEALFRELCAPWAGRVRLHHDDAARWLRRPRAPQDLIVEDLSVLGPAGTTKPDASLAGIPSLLRERLQPRGIAVVNLLPVPGVEWREAVARARAPFRSAALVSVRGFENRVLILGEALEPPRRLARLLRDALRGIGSRMAGAVSVARA